MAEFASATMRADMDKQPLPVTHLQTPNSIELGQSRQRGRQTLQVQRQTFETSRLLDFANKRELTAQIGHEPGEWPLVVIKELADNGIDACEEAGINPEITVEIGENTITVADNGPGLPERTIKGMLDFTVRASSREAYVGPTRGAQGNALKTLVAMPFALSGERGLVEITAQGLCHRISFSVDQIAQVPVIEQSVEAVPEHRHGTLFTIHWPVSIGHWITKPLPAEAGRFGSRLEAGKLL